MLKQTVVRKDRRYLMLPLMGTGFTRPGAPVVLLPSKLTGVLPLTQLRPPFSMETFQDSGEGDLMPVSSSGDLTCVVRRGTDLGSESNTLEVGGVSLVGAAAAAEAFAPAFGTALGTAFPVGFAGGSPFDLADAAGGAAFLAGFSQTLASLSFGTLVVVVVVVTGAFFGAMGGLAGPTLLFLSVVVTGEAALPGSLRGTGFGADLVEESTLC